MRRHFYLIIDSPDEDKIGGVDITEQRYVNSEKNTETRLDKRNLDTNETFSDRVVSLGYYDFEDESEYEARAGEVMLEKLGEIDEKHLENAGLDPEEVLS